MESLIIITSYFYSILIVTLSIYILYSISYNLLITFIDDIRYFVVYFLLTTIYFLTPYPTNYHCRILPQINMT